MAKVKSVIMALLVTFCFSATAQERDFTTFPMVDKNKIPNPSVLADRIEESLQSAPSGAGNVEGAYINPLGFLKAMQGASAPVATVNDLPPYLRTLQPGDMPRQLLTMSRILRYSDGRTVVDTDEGFARYARPGEVGWYDVNTGNLILAGDCANSPLNPVPQEAVQSVEIPRSQQVAARRPFAQYSSCPGGDPNRRYFQIRMYDSSYAESDCAKDFMFDHSGRNRGNDPTSWGDTTTEAFSKNCGEVFHRLGAKLGVVEHQIEITVEEGSYEYLLFKGTLTGDVLRADSSEDALVLSNDGTSIFIPETYQTGRVVVHFLDHSKVRTPTESGVGYSLSEFRRGCRVMVYSGIEQ